VKAAHAVRAITIPSLPVSLARIEHGQTNQKLTCAPGYNKQKNALGLTVHEAILPVVEISEKHI
jgi:hypothetical protein